MQDFEGVNRAGHQSLVGEVDGQLLYVSKDDTNENSGVIGDSKYTIREFNSFEEINEYYNTEVSHGKNYDTRLTI